MFLPNKNEMSAVFLPKVLLCKLCLQVTKVSFGAGMQRKKAAAGIFFLATSPFLSNVSRRGRCDYFYFHFVNTTSFSSIKLLSDISLATLQYKTLQN